MKRIIITGATSGIGRETALQYISDGWTVGVTGRRAELLKRLEVLAPGRVYTKVMDICREDAADRLRELIGEMGGMDVYLHCAGIGFRNPSLDAKTELDTARTNTEGFIRMVTAAFDHLKRQGTGGHIAVISSIAGTKGLGAAPAYSATKRFQNTYIDALDQLSRAQRLGITFTDIRPGFVDTDLLKQGHYPMLMNPADVARRIFHAVGSRKRVAVIDGRYRLLVAIWRLIPRLLWERMPVGIDRKKEQKHSLKSARPYPPFRPTTASFAWSGGKEAVPGRSLYPVFQPQKSEKFSFFLVTNTTRLTSI